MAFDNSANGRESTLLDLLRDLTLSGAKLPPIFSQLVGIHGQWIQASDAVGKAGLQLGKRLAESSVVLASLVGAVFRSERATNRLRDALNKQAAKTDTRVAEKFAAQNPEGDKEAFLEARKAYRETRGTKADKEQAARTAYENAASTKARNELGKTLEEIKQKSREKATVAADEAHGRTFQFWRSRGASQQQAERLANEEWRRIYQQTFRASKHAVPNVRAASEAAAKVASASRTAASVSQGASFSKLVTPGLTRGALAGVAGGAVTLGAGIIAQVGYLTAQDLWERSQVKKEGAMKAELAHQTLRNKVEITGIQQASQLRQTMFKAEEEMDRKRFENLRILAESKTKMNEADLAMQERLQQIEKQRLAAQKEVEIFRQKVSQAKETRQHYDTHVQQEAQVRDSAQFRTGFIESSLNTLSLGFRQRSIVDERGVEADDSVKAAVRGTGWSTKGTQQRALTSILSTAKMAREASMAAVKADFDEFVSAYETFAETISSTTVGSMAPEIAARIQKIKEESEAWMKNSSENQVQLAAGEIYSHSFQENVQAGRIKWDNETSSYVYQNENGITIAIKDADEFNSDAARSEARAAALAKEREEAEKKRLEEERKTAEKLLSYQQASLALVQEQVKRQEELLKNLRDTVAKNYESDMTGFFGPGNRKTSAEVREIMGNRSDEAFRDAVLASRAFAGNAQAAEEYKLNADIAIAGRRAYRKIDSDESREYLELYKKYQTELYSLQRKNIVEEHAMVMQNNTKIFQAYLDSIKQQREAYFRMLDKQLSIESTNANAFGRPTTEVMQDLQLNRIAQSFDQQKTDFESTVNIQKAASDAEFEESVRADESRFRERQLQERDAIEKQYIEEKYKLEHELAITEHNLRIELIKAEYDLKRNLDRAEKERDRNNTADMQRIAQTADREKLDEIAGRNFNGKKYDELTTEEVGELFSSIANEQQARLQEGMGYAGKKESDYLDQNGNLLTGDALRDAVRADVLKAYEGLDEGQKTGALGQRYQQVAEGLGNNIENQVMDAANQNEGAVTNAYENGAKAIEDAGEKVADALNAIAQKSTQNEIEYTNKKAKLESDQQLESNTRTEQLNQQRAAREAQWDTARQSGLKSLDLQQRQEEEDLKIGVRQIARYENTATNAFAEKLGATNGVGYTAARYKEMNEQQFNVIRDDMEHRHAEERRQAQANGASKQDMMRLEARQQLERQGVENEKKISDTMLQRRIGSETGNTSDMMSAWEQIQQSAFGHEYDPTVSAIDSFREQQERQLESLLSAQLDQVGRLDQETMLSSQIAFNTAALVAEARKEKTAKAETVQNTVIAQQGLAARNDGPKHLVAPGIAAPMGR